MPRDDDAAHQSLVQEATVMMPREHAQIAQNYHERSCDFSHELMPW